MRHNQIKIASLLSYFQMFLGVIIGLMFTPVMLKLLGKSEYGLYNTVSSTISMLSILSLGFNSSYIRYYSKYKATNDRISIKKLNGLFLIVFSIIGIIALVCGVFLSEHLDLVFKQGLTEEEYKTARILMYLLSANLSISFPMSVFSNIISAHEEFVFLKILNIAKTVVSPLVSLPVLLAGYGSIAIVTVTVIISLIIDTLYLLYVLFVLHEKFLFKNFEHGLFRDMFVYTSFIAINIIVDQINWNIDKLLLGRYRGTSSVAVYSVGYTLYTYYQTFSTSISGLFSPRIHAIINTTNNISIRNLKLTDLFVKIGRIQFQMLFLIASGIIIFGKYFIVHIWAGPGYESAYYVTLLLILPSTIALIQNVGIEIQRAQNKHQFRAIVYLLMALINVILSIFLCQKYGEIGSAIGTAISLIFANGLIMNIYYHKKCGINIKLFWKEILKCAPASIIAFVYGCIQTRFISINSTIDFLFSIALYFFVYMLLMWFMSMNLFEKDLIRRPFIIVKNRIFHRK